MKNFIKTIVSMFIMSICFMGVIEGCDYVNKKEDEAISHMAESMAESDDKKAEDEIEEDKSKENKELSKEEIEAAAAKGKYEVKNVAESLGYTRESQDIITLKNIDVKGRSLESIMLNFFTENVSWTDNGNGTVTFKGTSHFDDNTLPMTITYTVFNGTVIQGDWYMDGQENILEPDIVGYTIDIMCNIAGIEFDNESYALLSGMGENTSDYERDIVAGLLGQGPLCEPDVKENNKVEQYSSPANKEKLLFASMITAGLRPMNEEQMVNMFVGSGPKYTLAITTEQLLNICGADVGVIDVDDNGFYIGVETINHAWVFYCDFRDSNVYMLQCVNANNGKNVPLADSVKYLQSQAG